VTKPSTRTIVALAAAGVLVVIVAVAVVVTVAVRNTTTPPPALTVYAHGRTVTVPPYKYCTVAGIADSGQVRMNPCQKSDITVPVQPDGNPVQISLPKKIADAPWVMVREYVLPDRAHTVVRDVKTFRDFKSGTLALTVPSRPVANLRLIGIEMQLVLPARDNSGNEFFIPYQAWSIKTA
jgi:hypothetical protein